MRGLPRMKEAEMDSAGSRDDWVSGTAAAATGLGVLTFALFPLALPIVALTIVATLPLAVPLVVPAAVGAILSGMWLGVRTLARAVRLLRRPARGGRAGARPHPEPAVGARPRALG
jgi:hypothetical protein